MGNAHPFRVDPLEVVGILWKSRRLIVLVVGVISLLAAGISYLLPDYYQSTATVLPEAERGRLSSLTGISDLAALAGVNVSSEGSLGPLYPTIIRSESVLRNVVFARYKTELYPDSVNLIQHWKFRDSNPRVELEKALNRLRGMLEVSLDSKTRLLTISIETKEPKLSAEIVNRTVEELDNFMLTKRTTNASEQRKFIEGRLNEVGQDLARSEDALKGFREQNLQIRSAKLLLDEGRLVRAVQINTTLFVELKKQYELARIEEVKTLPVINVLDMAEPAIQKSRPRRSAIVVVCFLLAITGTVTYLLVQHYFGNELRRWVMLLRH